uniref:Uncharacterized protein n=1 Tax=Cucumis melo TaxID=3656 RepID=A0A9I9ECZ3_CUCME
MSTTKSNLCAHGTVYPRAQHLSHVVSENIRKSYENIKACPLSLSFIKLKLTQIRVNSSGGLGFEFVKRLRGSGNFKSILITKGRFGPQAHSLFGARIRRKNRVESWEHNHTRWNSLIPTFRVS